MKYIAEIEIMPHKELLDPQGKAVAKNMTRINVEGVEDVRIGKHIRMAFEAASTVAAQEKVDLACRQLLTNAIMETYSFHIKEA